MKNIRVVRKSGELVIKKQGTEWDVKELVTCITTDRVVREGEGENQIVYIYCVA